MLTYGSLCSGLLSGKMKPDSEFHGDDVRKIDAKPLVDSVFPLQKLPDAFEKLQSGPMGKVLVQIK